MKQLTSLQKKEKKDYKILIIVPRYHFTNKRNYLYMFPLGLAYISSVLKKNYYEVDCLNLNHCDGTIKEIIENTLNKKKYDFIGTGNNALGYNNTRIIIDISKNHPSKPKLILGGPIITTNPELYFKDLNIDFAVLGEGEETIIELLESLEKNKDLSKVNGIAYKDNEKIIITNPRVPLEDLDSMPYPDFEAFGFEEYLDNLRTNLFHNYNPFDNPRTYPILTSRACPFQCTFCYHEGKYRVRSMDKVLEELDLMIKKYKINIILVYDDCFSVNRERVIQFCKGIKKIQIEISWKLKWSVQLIVNDVDPEMLRIMKDAGCDTVSYGFESYSPTVLKSMKKPITPKQIDFAFNETLKAGLAVHANFIFGDVAETKETAKQTLDYWKKKGKGHIFLDFIQPYPGSEIYKHCLKKGLIKNEINFVKNFSQSKVLNMTNNMSDKDFKKLADEVVGATGNYCKIIKPLSVVKKGYQTYDVKVKCPFCKEKINYKNCSIENPLSYSFNLVCRNCHMRFFVANFLRRLAYQHHSKIRVLRSYQIRALNYLKKLRIKLSNK
ncbi:MAG: radical SAM protein [archaeon]